MKKNNYKKIKIFLLFVFFCLSAQVEANLDLDKQFTEILLKPEYPSAYETVTATVENYSLDLNNATIYWYLNGILKSQGKGLKEFSFQTKDFSEASTVEVVLTIEGGSTVTKKIKILPAEIDLVWEADTYIYPFYQAKAKNSHEAVMKVVALANFKKENGIKIPADELFFTWKDGWKKVASASGYGKNSFSLLGPKLYKEKIITVVAENQDASIKAQKSILIKNNEPEIVFYKKDPLLGILDNKNLEYFPLEEKIAEEVTIKAFPLFFSLENNDNIKYEWFVNDEKIKQENFERELTVRKTEGTKGSFNIELSLQDLKNFVLSARENFVLSFE